MKLDLKQQFKSYSFWLALASASFLLIQAVGKPLGLMVNEDVYMSIINSVLGIFVVLGIISYPHSTTQNKLEDNNNGKTSNLADSAETIYTLDDSKGETVNNMEDKLLEKTQVLQTEDKAKYKVQNNKE